MLQLQTTISFKMKHV